VSLHKHSLLTELAAACVVLQSVRAWWGPGRVWHGIYGLLERRCSGVRGQLDAVSLPGGYTAGHWL